MNEYDDSHGARRTGGVGLSIFAFQGVSEIHCPFVGETIKTMAVSVGEQLIVPCTHSELAACQAAGKDGNPDRDLALASGCPLGELWTAFDAFMSSLDDPE